MVASLHAIVILASLGITLRAHGRRPRWAHETLWAALPILGIGVVSGLLLCAYGSPTAEWLWPLGGTVVAGAFLKDPRAFRRLSRALVALALLLFLNGLYLRHSEYSSGIGLPTARGTHANRLGTARYELRDSLPADAVLPRGPAADVLGNPEKAKWFRFPSTVLRPEWHTFFTGLYRRVPVEGDVWFPGGKVADGLTHLEWIPLDPSLIRKGDVLPWE